MGRGPLREFTWPSISAFTSALTWTFTWASIRDVTADVIGGVHPGVRTTFDATTVDGVTDPDDRTPAAPAEPPADADAASEPAPESASASESVSDPVPEAVSPPAPERSPAPDVDLAAFERDLDAVEAALARLADGTYRTDEITGEPIPDHVLADDPTARRA